MKHEISSDALCFCCNTCILTEGGTDKTFQTKDKNPGQKPPRSIEREFVQGAVVRVFVLGLLKIGEIRDV